MKDDLGTVIERQYASYYIGEKKKENCFSSVCILHFVLTSKNMPFLDLT